MSLAGFPEEAFLRAFAVFALCRSCETASHSNALSEQSIIGLALALRRLQPEDSSCRIPFCPVENGRYGDIQFLRDVRIGKFLAFEKVYMATHTKTVVGFKFVSDFQFQAFCVCQYYLFLPYD